MELMQIYSVVHRSRHLNDATVNSTPYDYVQARREQRYRPLPSPKRRKLFSYSVNVDNFHTPLPPRRSLPGATRAATPAPPAASPHQPLSSSSSPVTSGRQRLRGAAAGGVLSSCCLLGRRGSRVRVAVVRRSAPGQRPCSRRRRSSACGAASGRGGGRTVAVREVAVVGPVRLGLRPVGCRSGSSSGELGWGGGPPSLLGALLWRSSSSGLLDLACFGRVRLVGVWPAARIVVAPAWLWRDGFVGGSSGFGPFGAGPRAPSWSDARRQPPAAPPARRPLPPPPGFVTPSPEVESERAPGSPSPSYEVEPSTLPAHPATGSTSPSPAASSAAGSAAAAAAALAVAPGAPTAAAPTDAAPAAAPALPLGVTTRA
nr:transcription initiation factor TFIID subunit 4-like [Aegilops tauschii subsp. strangulata]